MHEGHDFAPLENYWNTKVYATADGIVKKSGSHPTYGINYLGHMNVFSDFSELNIDGQRRWSCYSLSFGRTDKEIYHLRVIGWRI